MNRTEAGQFGRAWIEAWNRRDVETVLATYEDDLVFTSPRASVVVGSGTVNGKSALRAYWRKALEQIDELEFSLDRVLWDPEARELVILYTSAIDGQSKRVAELFRFGSGGLVAASEVFHGVVTT
jgi:hypothetical protein